MKKINIYIYIYTNACESFVGIRILDTKIKRIKKCFYFRAVCSCLSNVAINNDSALVVLIMKSYQSDGTVCN